MNDRTHERDFVGALEKGLGVIEAFDASNKRMTLSEVAQKTGMTRAAARRYLLTLTRLHYAEHDEKHYWLAPRVLRLGYAYLSSASLPRLAQPILEEIGDQTKEVASVAICEGTDMVFIARSANRRIVSATVPLGTAYPAYCTATGRVILAARSDEEVERFLDQIKPRKLTPKTKTGRQELLDEIAKVRQNGYAIIDEELELGLFSLAVPVTNARGQTMLGMSVSSNAGRMTVKEMIRQLLPSLKAGRDKLAAMI